jgi:hypothetical protein
LPAAGATDPDEPDEVVPTVVAPALGALELVEPDDVVGVVCALPLPVDEPVGLDWSSAAAGSVGVGVVGDVVPLVVPVPSGEPAGAPLPPPVAEVVPGSLALPEVVLAGDSDPADGLPAARALL